MKRIRQRLPLHRLPLPAQLLHTQIPTIDSPLPSSSSSSSISDSSSPTLPTKMNTTTLSKDDLTKINLLLPRLCLYNHHSTAITLLHTSLLSNPPLQSLPLPILSHSLASQSDFALTMSLLTRLQHNPNALLYSTPIAYMLAFSYCKRRKSREALKIFNWMIRPGSPCQPDERVFKTLISFLCSNGMTINALKVFRCMIDSKFVPDCHLRNWVFRSLLREALIAEAMELNECLDFSGDRNCSARLRMVSELLDRIISNWVE